MCEHATGSGSFRTHVGTAIERNLARLQRGQIKEIDFVSDMANANHLLNDSSNIGDLDIRAAWNFADTYFDAAKHGFPDVDGLDWQLATTVLDDSAKRMLSGLTIADSRVLRYG